MSGTGVWENDRTPLEEQAGTEEVGREENAMPYYNVFFKYVTKDGKLRSDHTKLDAKNMTDAKRRVIRGEKPKQIAVDRVVRV